MAKRSSLVPGSAKRAVRLLRGPRRAFDRMMAEDGFVVAGHLAFMAMLALFPFLIFMAALAGLLGSEEDVPRVLDLLFTLMPEDVAAALEPAVAEVVRRPRGGFLTLGVLATLWAASSGIEALRVALNRAYGVSHVRALWLLRLQSFVVVLAAGFLIIMISFLVVFGELIWSFVASFVELGRVEHMIWLGLRLGVGLLLMTAALTMLHIWLPNRPQPFRRVLPGALLTTLFFALGGTSFSFYLNTFANYSLTYGSLASVVIALMFFYAMALVFIYGAYFNATRDEADDASGG